MRWFSFQNLLSKAAWFSPPPPTAWRTDVTLPAAGLRFGFLCHFPFLSFMLMLLRCFPSWLAWLDASEHGSDGEEFHSLIRSFVGRSQCDSRSESIHTRRSSRAGRIGTLWPTSVCRGVFIQNRLATAEGTTSTARNCV